MMRLISLALLLSLWPPWATAGPWTRDIGSYFLSVSTMPSWARDQGIAGPGNAYHALYLEYGLRENLTLGLDLGYSGTGTAKAVAFLRYPLNPPDATLRLAVDLGLGQIDGAPVIRPGLSLGRAFETDLGYGWLAIDSLAEIRTDSGDMDFKMDVTVGLTVARGHKYMMQIQSAAPAMRDAYVRIAPSVAIPFGPGRHLEIGGSYGLSGDDSVGVKLGLWQEF